VGQNIIRTPKHFEHPAIWMLTKFIRRSYFKFRLRLSVSLVWCAGYVQTHLLLMAGPITSVTILISISLACHLFESVPRTNMTLKASIELCARLDRLVYNSTS
jgi:hypothetical protein